MSHILRHQNKIIKIFEWFFSQKYKIILSPTGFTLNVEVLKTGSHDFYWGIWLKVKLNGSATHLPGTPHTVAVHLYLDIGFWIFFHSNKSSNVVMYFIFSLTRSGTSWQGKSHRIYHRVGLPHHWAQLLLLFVCPAAVLISLYRTDVFH